MKKAKKNKAWKKQNLKRVKTGLFTVAPRGFSQYHKMLYPTSEFYYDACTGGKTGFTDQAGTTLVTFAEKNGKKLVCVCLHTYGAVNVYNDTRTLLEYGFTKFKHLELSADEISKVVNRKEADGTGKKSKTGENLSAGEEKSTEAISSGDEKDKKAGRQQAKKSLGRKITMIDTDKVMLTVPKKAKLKQITGSTQYDFSNFSLTGGTLEFNYGTMPVGRIGVHFESISSSVRSALIRAREKKFAGAR